MFNRINLKINIKIFFYFLGIYIVFFPTFLNGMSLFEGQKILYLSVPLLLIIFFILMKKKKIFINDLAYILLFIFLIQIMSIGFKIELINSFGDFLNYFRYLIYFLIFTITYSIGIYTNIKLQDVYNIIKLLFYLILFYLFINFIYPSILSSINPRPLITWNGLQIGGPFIWSYSLGFFFILIFFTFIKFNNLNFLKKDIYSFLLLSFILIMTQSKAVYLSILIIGILFFIFYFKDKNISFNKKFKIWVISLVMIILLIFLIINNLELLGNIYNFINGISNDNPDSSTAGRLRQLSYLNYTIDNNILFGYPYVDIVIENAYGYYLYNFGLIGLLSYLFLIIFLLTKNFRLIKKYQYTIFLSNSEKALLFGFWAYTFSIAFFSLGSSILDGHKSGYLFWLLLALYHSSIYNLKKEKIENINGN